MRLGPVLGLVVLTSSGCLRPFGDETPTFSPNVLAAGTDVPDVTSEPDLEGRIEGADGVTGSPVPLRNGYAAGAAVRYWDLGTAPRFANTMFALRHCDENGVALASPDGDVAHPGVVEAVPGDPSYSPFLRVWTVCVTDAYADQILPSTAAIEDAVTLGLVNEPTPTSTWFEAPILAPGTALTVDGNGTAVTATGAVYYDDLVVPTFFLGGANGVYTLSGSSPFPKSGRVYRIRRANDASFLEVVFSTARRSGDVTAASYTPLFRVVNVNVKATYVAGSATSESALFTVSGTTLTPVHPDITSFEQTDQYVNHEIQFQDGQP